ncbi:MAG: YuiB family protein [Planifilum sp.]
MSLPQVIISIPLFLVLLFGIGFILNMILKTTWLPSILYAMLIIGMAVYMFVERGGLKLVDWIILSAGMIGALLSGWTIKLLRAKGYRMF